MSNTYTDPAVLDVWLGGASTADLNNASVRVRAGHVDMLFRFMAATPDADRAAVCARIAHVFQERADWYAARDAQVPAQRTAS